MSADERKRVVAAAEDLADRIRETVKVCADRNRAVQLMQAILGTRVPDRVDLVAVGSAAAATVMAQPRAPVPQPVVGRSRSG